MPWTPLYFKSYKWITLGLPKPHPLSREPTHEQLQQGDFNYWWNTTSMKTASMANFIIQNSLIYYTVAKENKTKKELAIFAISQSVQQWVGVNI